MNVRLTRVLGWTAAAAFLASWILPVLPDIRGWEAFRYALAPLVPFRDADPSTWEDSAPQALSALTNVVFVLLFVFGVRKMAIRAGLFVRISIACFILNLYWFVKAWRDDGLADLLYGYYVWIAAFALLLILSVVAARRTSKTPTAGTPS
jgi:hypothetical protein